MLDLEQISQQIDMCKSDLVVKWILPIVVIEEMISLIKRQELEINEQVALNAEQIRVIDSFASPTTALTKDEEVLRLHRELASEKLRADQGWARYESANADRNSLRAEKVAASQPVAAQQHVQEALPPKQYGLAAYAQANADSRLTGNTQAAQDRGAETADIEPKSAISPLGKGGRGGAEAALSDEKIITKFEPHIDSSPSMQVGKVSYWITADEVISYTRSILASQQPAAAPSAPEPCIDPAACDRQGCANTRGRCEEAAPASQVQEGAARDERKPAMSMFASMEDYREALTDWEQNRHEAQERAAFEKAARRITHSDDASFERDGDDYHDYTQSRHWAFWQARAALASPAPVQPAPVADAYQQGRAAGIEEAAGMLDEMSGLMRSSYAQALIPKAAAAIRALAAKPSEVMQTEVKT